MVGAEADSARGAGLSGADRARVRLPVWPAKSAVAVEMLGVSRSHTDDEEEAVPNREAAGDRGDAKGDGMKARIMNRTVETPKDRVRDCVIEAHGHAPDARRLWRDGVSVQVASQAGSTPAPSPSAILVPNERAVFRSKLEAAYARYLHGLLLAGDIRTYRYEPMRFNLAPLTTITPDFQVILPDGSMEYHEVKGWARDDAMAKLKICARLYPEWKFWLVKRKRGVWDMKELPV